MLIYPPRDACGCRWRAEFRRPTHNALQHTTID
eukprot:SAG11_NODE_34720_length_270_cov_0.912281_1_plen_32_part_01